MTIEDALPVAAPAAEASDQANAEALDTSTESAATEGSEGEGEPAKKEKTPEERELQRMRRALDKRTRQLYELRAQVPSQTTVTPEQSAGTTSATQADDEPVTLSRAELAQRIKQEAEKLAPTIRSQQAEMEHRKGVVDGLAKEWGQEKFNAMASELDDVFGGLAGADGRPKAATDAIFESDAPKALIEYLTDPDNADEAEELAGASAVKAGRIVAKLEAKLALTKAAPQRSNAPSPIEPLKGGGKSTSSMPDPANTKAYMKWANEQERGRR